MSTNVILVQSWQLMRCILKWLPTLEGMDIVEGRAHKLHGRQQSGVLCRALATCSQHAVRATNSKRKTFFTCESSNQRPCKGFYMLHETRTLDTWVTRMTLCMPSLHGNRRFHKHDRRCAVGSQISESLSPKAPFYPSMLTSMKFHLPRTSNLYHALKPPWRCPGNLSLL